MTRSAHVAADRHLTGLYPRRFRDEYRSDLAELFSNQLEDDGPGHLWPRIARDMAVTFSAMAIPWPDAVDLGDNAYWLIVFSIMTALALGAIGVEQVAIGHRRLSAGTGAGQNVTTRSAPSIRRATSGGATHWPPTLARPSSVAPRATAHPFQT